MNIVTSAYQKPVKKTDAQTLMALALPMIEQGKTVKITVTGYSMYPLVTNRRDAVLLAKAEDVKVGDVPLFVRKDGSYILHRLVGKKDGAFVAMGDYETKPEYPIYRENVVAKAVGFYRKGRYIDCKSIRYRIYSFLWRRTARIRPFLLRTIGKIVILRKQTRARKLNQ